MCYEVYVLLVVTEFYDIKVVCYVRHIEMFYKRAFLSFGNVKNIT